MKIHIAVEYDVSSAIFLDIILDNKYSFIFLYSKIVFNNFIDFFLYLSHYITTFDYMRHISRYITIIMTHETNETCWSILTHVKSHLSHPFHILVIIPHSRSIKPILKVEVVRMSDK